MHSSSNRNTHIQRLCSDGPLGPGLSHSGRIHPDGYICPVPWGHCGTTPNLEGLIQKVLRLSAPGPILQPFEWPEDCSESTVEWYVSRALGCSRKDHHRSGPLWSIWPQSKGSWCHHMCNSVYSIFVNTLLIMQEEQGNAFRNFKSWEIVCAQHCTTFKNLKTMLVCF